MQKSYHLALLAALLLVLAGAMPADTFNYTFTSFAGAVATGTLTGDLIGGGGYQMTGGTIDLVGSPIDGTGTLVPLPAGGVFEIGGGTNLFGFDSSDINLLYPHQNPQIDSNGAFLFDITSGAGAGSGLAIFSVGVGDYGILGGNWTFFQPGGGQFSAVPAPEPGIIVLLAAMCAGSVLITRWT